MEREREGRKEEDRRFSLEINAKAILVIMYLANQIPLSYRVHVTWCLGLSCYFNPTKRYPVGQEQTDGFKSNAAERREELTKATVCSSPGNSSYR